MSTYLQTILNEIKAERKHQQCYFSVDFDDKHNLDNWVCFINTYCSRAANSYSSPRKQRRELLKAAALAVAACEAFDRNNGFPPRHYEE